MPLRWAWPLSWGGRWLPAIPSSGAPPRTALCTWSGWDAKRPRARRLPLRYRAATVPPVPPTALVPTASESRVLGQRRPTQEAVEGRRAQVDPPEEVPDLADGLLGGDQGLRLRVEADGREHGAEGLQAGMPREEGRSQGRSRVESAYAGHEQREGGAAAAGEGARHQGAPAAKRAARGGRLPLLHGRLHDGGGVQVGRHARRSSGLSARRAGGGPGPPPGTPPPAGGRGAGAARPARRTRRRPRRRPAAGRADAPPAGGRAAPRGGPGR